MTMSFEIISLFVWLLVLFQKHVLPQLTHICVSRTAVNNICEGFHVTQMSTSKQFVTCTTLLKMCKNWEGGSLLVK